MIIDSRIKPTEDDLLMYNFLKYYKLPVTIIATKYDKIKSNQKSKQEKTIKDNLKIEDGDNIVFFSSVNKKGRDEVYNIILENVM